VARVGLASSTCLNCGNHCDARNTKGMPCSKEGVCVCICVCVCVAREEGGRGGGSEGTNSLHPSGATPPFCTSPLVLTYVHAY
jgi:hypothetical protein